MYEEEEEAELPADDEAAMDDEMPMDDEAGMDDEMAGDEMEMDAEEPEEMEGTVELEQDDVDVLADLAEKLPDIVAKLQGGAPEEEPAGDEMDMDMGGEEPAMDMGDEEEEADEEEVVMEALRGVNLQLSNKEIVNEVARRVAKRILKAKQAQKKLDEALGIKKPVRRSRKK